MIDDVLWRGMLVSWMDTLRKYLMGFEEVWIVVWVPYIF
ncbi:hypothetical protein B398_06885 [Xylella fastidiosa 32]|nr:hypothetical protein B398_06885 [Xylella fastidiosa 32]